MTHWKLKSCPRCHGDVCVENGSNSPGYCLQCGARVYFTAKPKEERPLIQAERELVSAK